MAIGVINDFVKSDIADANQANWSMLSIPREILTKRLNKNDFVHTTSIWNERTMTFSMIEMIPVITAIPVILMNFTLSNFNLDDCQRNVVLKEE